MIKDTCDASKKMVSSLKVVHRHDKRRELIVMSSPEKNAFRGQLMALFLTHGFVRQKDLAEKFKVNPSTIRAILYGDRLPSVPLFYQMWGVLGDDFAQLMKKSPAWAELSDKQIGEGKPRRKETIK